MACGHAGFTARTAVEIDFEAILLARAGRGQWDQTLVVRLLGRPLMVIVKLRKALDCGEVLLV
jgi:hypothetical protein